MSDLFNAENFTARGNKEYFWYNICTEKIKYYFETYYSTTDTKRDYHNWFFSYNKIDESSKSINLLDKIN